MDTIGWIGSLLLAFCAVPQAWESYRTKSSAGLTWGFLILWFLGEIFIVAYVIPKLDWPLIFNYTCNLFFASIILWYKIKPGRS
jgi:uncharacterized protein with PQ loop repeat